ncbi:PHD finger protein [Acrasis kona]|uniref:PHD finger protein n=1 Tax=Acrasis kona TaxID=1008807 RepID=A0AAW2ZNR8_9EUKA
MTDEANKKQDPSAIYAVLQQDAEHILATGRKRKADLIASQEEEKPTFKRRKRKIVPPGEEPTTTTTITTSKQKDEPPPPVEDNKKQEKRRPNSGHDLGRPLNENEITVNMVIWSHIQGYPWWPSKVTKVEAHRVFVFFYGPDETDKWGWVSKNNCRQFDHESARTVYERPVKSNLHRSLRSATQEALVEYINQTNDTENEDLCYKCKTGGFLILCDGCMNACHCECDDPPMDSIPDGVWFCTECRKTNNNCAKNVNTEEAVSVAKSVQGILKNYVPYVAREDPVTRILDRKYWDLLSVGMKDDYDKYKKQSNKTSRRKSTTLSYSHNGRSKSTQRKRETWVMADLQLITSATQTSTACHIQEPEPAAAPNVQSSDLHTSTTPAITTSQPSEQVKKVDTTRRKKRKLFSESTISDVIEPQEGTCKLYIRYRFNNESDRDMKMVKCESQYKGLHIPKECVMEALRNDCCLCEYDEVRYYDREDRGWLSIRDVEKFKVESKIVGDEGNEKQDLKRLRVSLIIYSRSSFL